MLLHHLTVTPTNLSQKPLFIQGLLHFSYIKIKLLFYKLFDISLKAEYSINNDSHFFWLFANSNIPNCYVTLSTILKNNLDTIESKDPL